MDVNSAFRDLLPILCEVWPYALFRFPDLSPKGRISILFPHTPSQNREDRLTCSIIMRDIQSSC